MNRPMLLLLITALTFPRKTTLMCRNLHFWILCSHVLHKLSWNIFIMQDDCSLKNYKLQLQSAYLQRPPSSITSETSKGHNLIKALKGASQVHHQSFNLSLMDNHRNPPPPTPNQDNSTTIKRLICPIKKKIP